MKKLVNIEEINLQRLEEIKRMTGITTDTAAINIAITYTYCKLKYKEDEKNDD